MRSWHINACEFSLFLQNQDELLPPSPDFHFQQSNISFKFINMNLKLINVSKKVK